MALSLRTRIMVWGRSAYRCSFKTCRKLLEISDGIDLEPSLVGEIAHIVAEKPDGPRGESELSIPERNSYSNLMLVCFEHHKLIDDNPAKYSCDDLVEMKTAHETWVSNSLGSIDREKQRDDEIYASIIEEWSTRCSLGNWAGWTSYLLAGGRPCIYKQSYLDLCDAVDWQFNRVWPKRYQILEELFSNFLRVLSDLLNLLKKHLDFEFDKDLYYTKKFYDIKEWDEVKYNRLLNEFNYHVDLVCDLTLELTRAANRICDQVRRDIHSDFRRDEGVLTVESGDGFTVRKIRPEYAKDSCRYEGFEAFKVSRDSRDCQFGSENDLIV